MGDNRDHQLIERRPMDLAPAPVLKVEPPRNSPGPALLRTVPLQAQQTRYIATNLHSSGSSVPSSSSSLAKPGNAASASGTVVNRLNTQTSSTPTSTYHVPRGAAAVANIAVPRSSLATPILRGSSTLQTISVATSANQPGLMRAASPAALAGGRSGPTWLSVATTQPPRHHNNNTFIQNRMPAAAAGRVSGTAVSTRPVLVQANPPHKPLTITQQPHQVHITEKKFVQKASVLPAAVMHTQGRTVSRLATPSLRPVMLSPPGIQIQTSSVNTRPVLASTVRLSSAPGVSKVYCQTSAEPSVYIQTTHKPGQGTGGSMVSIANSLYSLPANSFYDSSMPTNFHTFTTAPATTPSVHTSHPTSTQVQGLVTAGQPVRFNPVMVVDHTIHPYVPNECGQSVQTTEPCNNTPVIQLKQNASPRPSILRKRDTEGTPGKAAKNLNPIFGTLTVSTPSSPPSPPKRPDSRGNGGAQSSGGSTTISATSSPGLGTDSPPLKTEEERPVEMSPRKKPRKQQLSGNQMQEPKFSDDEMEFISTEKIKKKPKEAGFPQEVLVPKPITKRPKVSLLRAYRPTWKAKHHHYLRYSDVKPREEKRPSLAEIATQKNVLQRVNGWKIYHLGAQMTDISNTETDVYDQLTTMLKALEKKSGKDGDINRVNELIKGNIQRSKVITDQLQEAKCQVMKLFDHKCHVTEVLTRFSSRRSGKKRERV